MLQFMIVLDSQSVLGFDFDGLLIDTCQRQRLISVVLKQLSLMFENYTVDLIYLCTEFTLLG